MVTPTLKYYGPVTFAGRPTQCKGCGAVNTTVYGEMFSDGSVKFSCVACKADPTVPKPPDPWEGLGTW
jgi:hypothetical protein